MGVGASSLSLLFLSFSVYVLLSFSTQTLNGRDEPRRGVLRTVKAGLCVVLASVSNIKDALGFQTHKPP